MGLAARRTERDLIAPDRDVRHAASASHLPPSDAARRDHIRARHRERLRSVFVPFRRSEESRALGAVRVETRESVRSSTLRPSPLGQPGQLAGRPVPEHVFKVSPPLRIPQ
jgi:hypothetical protein